MKDNKIDIMCKKLGDIRTELHKAVTVEKSESEGRLAFFEILTTSVEQLQYDLELLRKCTLDNPDFKWEDVK